MRFGMAAVFLLFTWLLLGCSSNKFISQAPLENSVIDGKYDDWKGIPVFYNEKPPFLLAATNSNERLNLILRSNDPRLVRQMRAFGFVLWLDGDKTVGVELPGQRPNRDQMNREERQALLGVSKQGELVQIPLSRNDFFLIIKDSSERIPLSQIEPFQFASGNEEGVYSLEFGLPLLRGNKDKQGIRVIDGKKIKICIELHGIFSTSLQRPGKSMGMGMGGRGGGGKRGMTGQNPGMQKNPPIEKKEIWFDIKLD